MPASGLVGCSLRLDRRHLRSRPTGRPLVVRRLIEAHLQRPHQVDHIGAGRLFKCAEVDAFTLQLRLDHRARRVS